MNERPKQILSIFFPLWSIDILRQERKRKGSQDAASPERAEETRKIFLTAECRGEEIIARCCLLSKRAGVARGMSLANARALAGEAEVLAFDPEREVGALGQLARWAYRFTPLVAPDAPAPALARRWIIRDPRYNGIALDITGSSRLFEGESNLLDRIGKNLERFGVNYRMALSPTLGASWAISRYSRERVTIVRQEDLRRVLSPLPVAALRISEETESILREVNINSLEELLQLSRKSLLPRFGAELLRRLDQTLGFEAEPLEPIRIVLLSKVEKQYPSLLSNLEIIKLAALELLEELLEKLRKRQLRPSQIVIRLKTVSGRILAKEVLLSMPTLNEVHVGRLLENKIEKLRTPEGIEEIVLIANRTETCRAQHTEFLAVHSTDSTGEEQLGELLDTLLEHLGAEQVHRLESLASHLPERALRLRAVNKKDETVMPPAPVPSTDRPSLLLNIPQPIRAMATLPDGPPFWVKWKEKVYQIEQSIGPERISPEWWKQEEGRTRDYFKVRVPSGTWLWIYREVEGSRWFLQGFWS